MQPHYMQKFAKDNYVHVRVAPHNSQDEHDIGLDLCMFDWQCRKMNAMRHFHYERSLDLSYKGLVAVKMLGAMASRVKFDNQEERAGARAKRSVAIFWALRRV
jgi:hypothetical protein